jgi:hypothetical protein
MDQNEGGLRMSVVWALLAVLVILGGIFFVYNKESDEKQSLRTFSGYVARIDAEKQELIVRPIFEAEAPPFTVLITPETRIERMLEEGTAENPGLRIEVNITDMEQGERVTIRYSSTNARGSFTRVERVELPVNSKFSKEFFVKDNDRDLFFRGKVVSFDGVGRSLEFIPLDASGEHLAGVPDTLTVTLREDFRVFSIDDLARSPILHARAPSNAKTIAKDSLISIVFKRGEPEALAQGITGTILVLTPNAPIL